jgi:sugar phosphate isomerase/epimerase
MKLVGSGAHLTYCTNVHPSESWAEVQACLRKEVSQVKAQLCPNAALGVGLRVSAVAAEELLAEDELGRLVELLDELGLYVFTLNGFPYGPFHGKPIKEKVYLPDWRDPARATYTDKLRRILSAVLPLGLEGSISTVPGGFRSHFQQRSARQAVATSWLLEAAKLWKHEQETGQLLRLAIEPEPECMLETTAELVRFFETHLLSAAALSELCRHSGLKAKDAEAAVHRHLGICLDACHAAVEFEDPVKSVKLLQEAGIHISKLQLSSGLCAPSPDSAALEALASFEDEVYLHQTVVQRAQQLSRYFDLPEALADEPESAAADSEWRVHFHVPIFQTDFGPLKSTQDWLRRLLHLHKQQPLSSHLEVETYTWNVLPEEYRVQDLSQALVRELSWVIQELSA